MRLAALLLAAGKGQRFGGSKLAAPFRGAPLIDHALSIACAAPVGQVLVVARDDLCVPSHDPRVEVLRITSDGIAQSLQAGLDALTDADGAFIFLADMPLVPSGLAAELLAHKSSHLAVQPTFAGKPGHPVLLDRRGFALAARASGDSGLGRLLRGRQDVLVVPVNDRGVVCDADTPEALAALERDAPPA